MKALKRRHGSSASISQRVYLCSILDSYSRSNVHWGMLEKMDEFAVETIIQRARERFQGENPRIIIAVPFTFISHSRYGLSWMKLMMSSSPGLAFLSLKATI